MKTDYSLIPVVGFDHHITLYQEVGGISRYFYEIISNGTRAAFFQARVFSPLHVNQYLLELPRNIHRGIYAKRLPLRGRELLSSLIGKLERLVLDSKCVDLVHSTWYPTKKNATLPLVITIHDLIPEIEFKRGQTPERFLDLIEQRKACVKIADGIVFPSHHTEAVFKEFFPQCPAVTAVIPHGVSLQAEYSSQMNWVDYGSRRSYLLYVGKRSGYKNFKVVLSAWIMLRREIVGLQLICAGGPALRSETELDGLTESERSDLIQRTVSDAQLVELYRFALALVFPSTQEGFGMPILEAMAVGTPVVLANASCLPEVGGSAGFYFDPSDPNELFEKLLTLIKDGDLWTEVARAGFDQAGSFSWDRSAQAHGDFYRQVLI